jgi:hypothetical protein
MSSFPESLRDGRYAVVGVLGEGGQAQTLSAVDKLHGRPVAIKRFVVRGAPSWKDVELAEREARVLSGLCHAHLPAYFEHFEENGELYLVMERVEGESLRDLRRRGGRLSRAELMRLLSELGALLDYLHGHAPPIVHRDIKPANIVRRSDGRFMLVDFGSVRDRLRPEGGSTVVGTFGYMAPEQFQGRAMPQTDVFALGATVLALATGEEPENLPHQGLRLDVQRALPGDPELARLLAQLLEPDPDRRPSRVLPLLGAFSASRPEPRGAPEGRSPAFEDVARDAAFRARPAGPLPPIALVVLLTGLRIARVAVRLAVGIFVPVLLVLLSLAFGHGLRRAAKRVRKASKRADRALVRASALVRRVEIAAEPLTHEPPSDAPHRRVPQHGPGRRRVRVVDTTAEEVSELEDRDEFDHQWRERSSHRD